MMRPWPALILCAVLAGCETIKGAGRDITNAGEAIEEALGLNDVVVNMGPLPRSLDLELRLGGATGEDDDSHLTASGGAAETVPAAR